ncbi:hypothetical protein SAMN05444955_11433 [Lihuaxuella thermophila]|uniref:Uncharacterized protein n=1 Tax=Lihuaxuella thermophila TaxID=1173111 RepID=A0A1H8HHW1_9BACL|nr:hypothetical protein SAMN05444955_11433 [Lihuaxuella thermophila]
MAFYYFGSRESGTIFSFSASWFFIGIVASVAAVPDCVNDSRSHFQKLCPASHVHHPFVFVGPLTGSSPPPSACTSSEAGGANISFFLFFAKGVVPGFGSSSKPGPNGGCFSNGKFNTSNGKFKIVCTGCYLFIDPYRGCRKGKVNRTAP